MERFTVLYDKSIEDKGRDSYLRAIKKHIPYAEFIDISNYKNHVFGEELLFVKPLNEWFYNAMVNLMRGRYPSADVEGVATGRLTITAEAILRVIGPVDKKTVVIINQSNVLGIPLAKELIERGANVISLNSSYPCVDNLLTMTDVDILVSASGQGEFELDRELTRMIDVKIDLSNDLEDPIKITSVPTIEVLKDSLKS